MTCVVREHAEINTYFTQRFCILSIYICAEDQLSICITMQPAILLNFLFGEQSGITSPVTVVSQDSTSIDVGER